jgi:hypothetical protein
MWIDVAIFTNDAAIAKLWQVNHYICKYLIQKDWVLEVLPLYPMWRKFQYQNFT